MRKLRFTIFGLLFLIFPFSNALAQHQVVLDDFLTNGKFINDEIAGDTLSNGARRDSAAVYVLKRGGIYEYDVSISNTGYPLVIQSNYDMSQSEKPIIIRAINTTTNTYPGSFATINNNVSLKNLVIIGMEDDTSTSQVQGGILTTGSSGWNISVDSCILGDISGQILRTGNSTNSVKLTNNIFFNMGNLVTSNFGAGKGIDFRDVACDSVIIQNNTFVNSLDRIIRHLTSTASLNHVIFDHNTIVNSLAYHGLLSLGWVGADVRITNNLFQDPFALGNDTDYTRQVEFITNELDPYTGKLNRMAWIFTDTSKGNSATTNYVVSNNYYSISDSGQAFFGRLYNQPGGLPIEYGLPPEGSPLTWFINKKIADSTKAFIKDNNIKLTNVPKLATNLMAWYRSPNGGNKTKNTPTSKFDKNVDNYDMRTLQYFTDTLNCKYSTTVSAYTGSTNGGPVGDLNWWGIIQDVKYNPGNVVSNYTLSQNYPNPFNPSTKFSYSLPKSSIVSIIIYNSLGQIVTTLVNSEEQKAGNYDVNFNGKDSFGNSLASGVYFYQLRTNEVTITKKMLLLK
jgi:hypothetical protein